MPITKPYSIAVLVFSSNANVLISLFLISLNGFSLKSLSKYCLANTVLKVAIKSSLHS